MTGIRNYEIPQSAADLQAVRFQTVERFASCDQNDIAAGFRQATPKIAADGSYANNCDALKSLLHAALCGRVLKRAMVALPWSSSPRGRYGIYHNE